VCLVLSTGDSHYFIITASISEANSTGHNSVTLYNTATALPSEHSRLTVTSSTAAKWHKCFTAVNSTRKLYT